jgi:hypothetical protein
MSVDAGHEHVPDELITAVVNLVGTGPVPLGAYTPAEMCAVGGLIDFLEHDPSQEVIGEAVRSLAARDLITTDAGETHIDVRGDLGIALAFQHRTRVVLDARRTGTEPDTPWRFLLMTQPEQVTLEVLIDTLGIHFFWLRKTDDALRRVLDQLPAGEPGPREADLDAILAASPHTALVTVTRWRDGGERENTDVILAREDDRLHVFLRDPDQPERFAAQGLGATELRTLINRLLAQPS